MPVERRSGTQQVRSIVIAVVALALAVGLAWAVVGLASGGDGPVRLQLGDDEFDAGQATRLSAQIAEDGPVLFSDVSGRGQVRPIMVNHFGDDAEIRWVAFPAVLPGADDGCFLFWDPEGEVFRERRGQEGSREGGELCSDRTVPPNGEGLTQYDWEVDDEGNLIVDLRNEDADVTGPDDAGTTAGS